MIDKSRLGSLISNDLNSKKKRRARVAQRYYESRHDILDYRIFYINKDGKLVEDKTRANVRIAHPFFTELVDQKVQYILSGEINYSKDDRLNDILKKEYFNEIFTAELMELMEGCSVKGFDYLYAYKDENLRTKFKYADGFGIIELKEDGEHDLVDDTVIYYYPVKKDDNKVVTRIEVWDSISTTYYIMGNGKEIEFDPNVKINPRPHILYKQDDKFYMEELGYLPIFRLDNNRKQRSDLEPIKSIIDDYDLMDCGLSNNIQDLVEGIYVVKGFEGHDIDELQFNVKQRKVVGVGEGGDLDIRTINIPTEARKVKMEEDEKNIYRFGMGFNSSQSGDGNITNIVIKSRYALLDLKCNKFEIHLSSLLLQLCEIVLPEVNEKYSTFYTTDDIEIEIIKEVMTNAADNATIEKTKAETLQLVINTILYVQNVLDEETIARKICDALDIDYEEIKDRLPKQSDQLEDAAAALEDEQVREAGGAETAPE